MTFKTIKDAVLVILVFICGGLILGGNRMSSNFKSEEKKYREKISELLRRNAELDLVHKREVEVRIEELEKQKQLIDELKGLKKRDSIRSVRTITSLISTYKKYSDPQLDSMLILEYEKAIISGN